ncbi:hypothetical protein [Agreia sp.]|uniref:hypothetical protein n=1 Tax=Agreia sp. TaxID=1872416 RepID=UPI0035BC4C43
MVIRRVPGGEEKYRYDMPTVMLGGRYGLHYAAWKKFIGIYPVAASRQSSIGGVRGCAAQHAVSE